VLFEYDPSWIQKGIELSPIHLPTARRSFQFETTKLNNGLPGLFADSLPDGWGILIMNRFFLKRGIKSHEITPIDRLAYLGNNAMGALCYQPPLGKEDKTVEAVNIGSTAKEAYELYEGKIEDAGRLLAKIGGSPGGARPKALIGISDCGSKFISGIGSMPPGFSHWMVKFSGPVKSELRELGPYEGIMEYIYLHMAQTAGITVPEYRLIADEKGLQHIAVRRFDRPAQEERLHVATAFGLLHADHRSPTLDYQDLLKFAWMLTKDATQVTEQFRRAVFNLLAINRDDHSKNHGYMMEKTGKWKLSPAYDLTYSNGPGGEHWTSYLGEGKKPPIQLLLQLATLGSIGDKKAISIIEQVRSAVGKLPALCKEYDVPTKYSRPIIERVKQIS
jgi:serine/threonine-protein kinase HipA